MSALSTDSIVLDTNIFLHLANHQENKDNHIDNIFKRLIRDKIRFLVDCKKVIIKEYGRLIAPVMKSKSGKAKGLPQIMRYFMTNQEEVHVERKDALMTAITGIVGRDKVADRTFVYVAFKKGRILITNDRADIIDEGTDKGERRKQLLRKTKKYRPRDDDKSDILTSQEAYNELNTKEERNENSQDRIDWQ